MAETGPKSCKAQEEATKAAQRMATVWHDNVAWGIEGGLLAGIQGGTKGLVEYFKNVAVAKMVRILSDGLAGALLAHKGKGGFLGATAAAAGSLFTGFADGGQFMVNGKSGVDSNLVAFRASNRERVTIETPAQQRRSGTTGGDNYITLNAAVRTREGVEETAIAGVLRQPEVLAPMAIDYTQDYLSNSFGNR